MTLVLAVLLSPFSLHAEEPKQGSAFKVIKVTDITAQLTFGLARITEFAARPQSYEDLSSYYRKNIGTLGKLYPAGTIEFSAEDVLERFNDKLRLTSLDVHFLPFLPLVPEQAFEINALKLSKLELELDGSPVYGLRVEASVALEFLQQGVSRFTVPLTYISSLNARAMGFTHGQLILSKSRGVEPAAVFEYNGEQQWSSHAHYRREDQISRSIRLTNVAHASGATYNISSDPDFALQASFTDERPVVMTFYLWKAPLAVFPLMPPGRGSPPDFVYQFVLKNGTASR